MDAVSARFSVSMIFAKYYSQGKRSFPSGKRGFHPCFCLPACCNCPVALSEFAALILIIQLCLNLTASKNAIAAGKTDCKIKFASQMWATRPHLGSIFVKLLHRKTFQSACGGKSFSFAHLHIFPKSLTFFRLSFIIKNNPAHIVQKIIEMRKL